MKRFVLPALTLAVSLATSTSFAQSAPAANAAGTGPAASAPAPGAGMGRGPGAGMGMGMGMGRGMGMGPGAARWGDGVTPGWSMMTPEERMQHQQTMLGFGDAAECRAYVRRHHAEMAARALAQGQQIPPTPRRDPCARLQR